MPRDSGGNYTLPAGNPVVSGTIIESDWANNTMDDIKTAMTDSLSRTGNGGMLVPFKAADGTSASPSYTFTNNSTYGMYLDLASQFLGFSVAAANVFRLKAAGAEITGSLTTSGEVNGATPDEMSYLDGLLSNAQAQINGLQSQINGKLDAFPSGTKMLFQQTSAPTGWTKDATHNDKSLRIVSGTVGSGGTVPFTTVFSSARTSDGTVATGTVAGHALSISEMPIHDHDVAGVVTVTGGTSFRQPGGLNVGVKSGQTGGGQTHTHGLTINSHTHNTNLDVQYVDTIIAAKD